MSYPAIKVTLVLDGEGNEQFLASQAIRDTSTPGAIHLAFKKAQSLVERHLLDAGAMYYAERDK